MEHEPEANRELADLEEKFKDREMLWDHSERFNECHEEWYKGNF